MDGKKFYFIIGLVLITGLLSGGVLASFNSTSNDLITSYSAGETIKGKFNLSMDSHPVKSLLTSNFEGTNITLLDFMKSNNMVEGTDYSCNFVGCKGNYIGGESVSEVSLTEAGSVIGFKLAGSNIQSVNSLEFKIGNNIPRTCGKQIMIDFLDTSEYVLVNSETSGNVCGEAITGCFEDDGETTIANIGSNYYCEKISLPMAPAYKLIANVKSVEETTETLKMSLWSAEPGELGTYYGDCELPLNSEVGTFQPLGCVVNHPTTKFKDYFVCVKAESANSEYRIKTETNNDTGGICGGTNAHQQGMGLTTDFDISAQIMEFESISNWEINDDLFEGLFGEDLSDLLTDYISEKYGNSCSSEDCIIPIKLSGNENNIIASLSDSKIIYTRDDITTEDDAVYDTSILEATMSAENVTPEISYAGFTIPIGSEADKFQFYIGGELAFEQAINVSESFYFEINPTFVHFGQTTIFEANTSENIVSSTWDFGDNSTSKTVSGKEIEYRYLSQDTFNVEVELTRDDGATARRTFSVEVGNAREIAIFTIRNYRERIESLRTSIDSQEDWISTEIEKKVDLSIMNSSLNSLEEQYNSAVSDEEYAEVMLKLLNTEVIDIPIRIDVVGTGSNNFPLIMGYDNMDMSYIEDLSGSTVKSKDNLKKSVISWMEEFYKAEISVEQISLNYVDKNEVLMTKFRLEIDPKKEVKGSNGTTYEPKLILGYKIEDYGKFKLADYGQKSASSSGTYIALNSEDVTKVFEFVIFDKFPPENLGAYISPNVKKLNSEIIWDENCNWNGVCDEGETAELCETDCGSRWKWFTIWQISLLFIFLVVYIVLQEWYKKHYEGFLFKNDSDMYNLVNFVYNARKDNNLTNSQISDKLKEAGWSGEKITYALKKIDGNRTGMFEIPIFKIFENKKVKKEIESRQGGVADTRFIKQRGQ